MSFKFVSHEEFPEDLYTKEIVYLLFDDKYRQMYVRKQSKNGGMFWSVPSIGVMKEGVKVYLESFLQDSTFMAKDIRLFLENRAWEKKEFTPADREVSIGDDEIPF